MSCLFHRYAGESFVLVPMSELNVNFVTVTLIGDAGSIRRLPHGMRREAYSAESSMSHLSHPPSGASKLHNRP